MALEDFNSSKKVRILYVRTYVAREKRCMQHGWPYSSPQGGVHGVLWNEQQ
jgi:hypothetical protein